MFSKSLFTVALVATSQTVCAQQQLPNAGNQLQQIPPAPAPTKALPLLSVERKAVPALTDTAGPRVRVDRLRLTGQDLYPENILIAASGFVPGRDLTLGELRDLAARISRFLNDRGFVLAQAYLPAQDVNHGEVTIAVIEGHYGKIDIRNTTALSTRRVERVVSGIETGDVVATTPLERRLLLLSDIAGVKVKSTLAPGEAVGTSDLIVDIEPARRISGSVEADNAGNRYTGTYRLGGSVNLNDPTGIGDLLSVRLLGSTGGLGYGRVAYQAPIGNATLGIAYTHLRYVLGKEFASLDAGGKADIFSAFASYPVIRSRRLNLYALANADAKLLTDNIGAVSARSHRDVESLTLGLGGDSHDRSGSDSFAVGWTFGNLHFRDPLERARDALAARSGGGFNKLQASGSRLQTIAGPLAVYGALRGQVAFANLDSSEKMELGGAYSVRAYPEGEAYGDDGYVATVEARVALNRWTASLPGQLELIGFVDTGEVRLAHDPGFIGSNHARRSGIGAGLNWAGPDGFSARASYARKLGTADVTSGPDKAGRAWFQLSKIF